MSRKRVHESIDTHEPSSKKANTSLVPIEMTYDLIIANRINKNKTFHFHPNLIIVNYFDSLINKLDVYTETRLCDQTLSHIDKSVLNESRQTLIEKIDQVREENLSLVKFDEDKYTIEWCHIISDENLSFEQKVEIMSERLISQCCLLFEDKKFASGHSLWLLPRVYCDRKQVEMFG